MVIPVRMAATRIYRVEYKAPEKQKAGFVIVQAYSDKNAKEIAAREIVNTHKCSVIVTDVDFIKEVSEEKVVDHYWSTVLEDPQDFEAAVEEHHQHLGRDSEVSACQIPGSDLKEN